MDEISEAFEGTTLIENTGGLLADVEIPELKPVLDADEEKEPEDEDSGNLDDFFSWVQWTFIFNNRFFLFIG